jgi:hypothetical protein
MDTNPSGQERTHDSVSIAMYSVAGASLLVLSPVIAATQSGELHPGLVFVVALMYVIGAALLAVGCIAQGIVVASRQDPPS